MSPSSQHGRVGLLGRGALGEEILHVLEERRVPLGELRVFATDASGGEEVEFGDDALRIEKVEPERVASCDLVLCAAPDALMPLLPTLREAGVRVVDLSGALEREPTVPLALPGWRPAPDDRLVAVPRGIAAGLGLALRALSGHASPVRLSVTTLEPAAGVGRDGVRELAQQTVELLNRMTGEAEAPEAFPRALAFDCLPVVGEPREGGATDGEESLAAVLGRLLGRDVGLEITRLRVPLFMGTLAALHVELADEPDLAALEAAFDTSPLVRIAEPGYPTPRDAVGRDAVSLGRLRRFERRSIACVLVQDDLRRGAATAVDLAEAFLTPS